MSWSSKHIYPKIKKQIKDLFYLPRADRKVLFVFTLLLLAGTAAALLVLHLRSVKNLEGYRMTPEEQKQVQELYAAIRQQTKDRKRDWTQNRKRAPRYYAVQQQEWASLPFDPNTADSTRLLALGLAPWQVRNIYKYRAKGGRFHRKEDLLKIYGMTGEQAEHLLPLVRIDPKYQYIAGQNGGQPRNAGSASWKDAGAASPGNSYPINRKFREKTLVDPNTADTALLKRIPGIGNGFASMIIRRRQQLGGFVSVSQLKEIRNLPDSLLEWFRIAHPEQVRRLNLNRASLSQLKRHPYLNFYQCKVIVEHRRKYGKIRSLKDLSLYEEFSRKDLERLRPYCTF